MQQVGSIWQTIMDDVMISEECWKKIEKNVKMSAKHGAKGARELKNPTAKSSKGHALTITIDDIKEAWKNQNGKCYWLGIDMSMEDLFIPNSPFAPSVDRLKSDQGYHKDNIVLTLRFANRGRGAYDGEDFKSRLDSLLHG